MIRFILPLIIVAQALLSSTAWAQGEGQAPPPKQGGAYRRPLANNPSNLDPAHISDTYGFTVAQQIFDGLVQYDGSLTITPAIAQSWKASRDGLSWTFFLRKGVKFHNGREVVADDVVYSFTRILDPKTNSKAAEVFLKLNGAKDFVEGRAKSVRGLRALDRYTVQIELAETSAPFVASLAVGYAKIVPREVVEKLGAEFGSRPMGTGPFKFVRWKKDEEIVLEANLDYFGGRPFLDRLEYKIFPGHQRDAMLASFETGGLEDTDIPAAELERVQSNGRYQFVRRPILGIRFFGFQTLQGPLANRMVRQAINHAVDREALVQDIHKNRYKAGQSFLPPGTYGYDPQYRPYPFDPQRAMALLAKAGYPGGKGLPVLQFWSSVKSADIEREHEAIKRYLGEVGIRGEFQYHTNWPEFKAMVQQGKLPIFRWGWVADVPEPDDFLYNLFHSRGRTNLTSYQNARVDRLLDRARAEQVYLKRIELYREAERLIMEDSPIIPLNYYSYERLFQPYVKSIEVSALGDPYIPMRKIWLAK
ncbi:MAG: ABC transporter substrate-binding protein [candidate division NC10 bacterium]|nr:ABC transporter substrate-binding protein [candidate division NC10 bacterium]